MASDKTESGEIQTRCREEEKMPCQRERERERERKRGKCVSEQERRRGVRVYVRECNRVCEDGGSVCSCKTERDWVH